MKNIRKLLVGAACMTALGMVSVSAVAASCTTINYQVVTGYLWAKSIDASAPIHTSVGYNPPPLNNYKSECIDGKTLATGTVVWSSGTGAKVPFTLSLGAGAPQPNDYWFTVIGADAMELQFFAGSFNGLCNPSAYHQGNGYVYMNCKAPSPQ